MDYEKVKDKFGTWAPLFKEFVESNDMDNIFRHLKAESIKGKKICPLSKDVFRCFKETNKDDLKCIIAGISPYHTYVNDKPVADGIALSCSVTGKLQPSLEQVYHAIEQEYTGGVGLDIDMIHNPDLTYLAKQGVLLYNVALTTEKDKACSMQDIWSEFNKYFWQKVINQYYKGTNIILLGQQAWKSEQWIAPLRHYVYKLNHPAGSARRDEQWSSQGVFQKVNTVLQQNNNSYIEWVQHKHTEEKRQKQVQGLPPWIEDRINQPDIGDLPF